MSSVMAQTMASGPAWPLILSAALPLQKSSMCDQPQSATTISLYRGKLWGDPDYDVLMEAFRRLRPAALRRWRAIEQALFERRAGPGLYPDLDLMRLCEAFIAERSVDSYGGLGTSRAWRALRGRVLRDLIEETPNLHPAPGRMLISEPRTLTDEELVALAQRFGAAEPALWAEWRETERGSDFEDDPLAPVQYAFYLYLKEHCWVQCTPAFSSIFVDIRGLLYRDAPVN